LTAVNVYIHVKYFEPLFVTRSVFVKFEQEGFGVWLPVLIIDIDTMLVSRKSDIFTGFEKSIPILFHTSCRCQLFLAGSRAPTPPANKSDVRSKFYYEFIQLGVCSRVSGVRSRKDLHLRCRDR